MQAVIGTITIIIILIAFKFLGAIGILYAISTVAITGLIVGIVHEHILTKRTEQENTPK
jgi:hypothetical protein